MRRLRSSGLLFTCLLLGRAGVAFVLALIARNYGAARKVLAAGIIVLGAYAAVLLIDSLLSRERVLGPALHPLDMTGTATATQL